MRLIDKPEQSSPPYTKIFIPMKDIRRNTTCLPPTNHAVAECLFVLEVAIRELIIETLSASAGPKWFKRLLPSDITQKYIRGKQAERAAKWSEHIEHHPLYYIDFPDLAKVLSANWKATFQRLFSNKEVFLGNLKSLEPIRNKLAHNRKLSENDRTVVMGVMTCFESAIGKQNLRRLVANCTAAPSIPEIMEALKKEAETASEVMNSLTPPRALPRWHEVKNAWWFDNGFLTASNHDSRLAVAESKLSELKKVAQELEREVNHLRSHQDETASSDAEDLVAPIVSFFELYEEFASRPRKRGTGHKLEAWKAQHDVLHLKREALGALSSLAGESND